MSGVFHSYDIRGIFGKEIDVTFAQKLGVAFVEQYKPKVVVVGHDERIGSDVLSSALVDTLLAYEIKVIDIGLCTTPMVWHAVNMHATDGGIMVTASHNPKEYVGFKLCKKFAIPIGYESGLSDIEHRINTANTSFEATSKSNRLQTSEQEHYKAFAELLIRYVPDQTPLKIIADCSSGAVAPILVSLFAGTRHEIILINDEPDGNFPAHEPNPLIKSTTDELSARVITENADFGVIFDGDADRVVFVDEKGVRIRPDLLTALLAQQLLNREFLSKLDKKNKIKIKDRNIKTKLQTETPIILADLRSSKSVEEIVKENGGQLFLTKVGRPYIINQLRATKGLLAGELSGHYYFSDFYCCDDGVRALLEVMQLIAVRQQKMSEIIFSISTYFSSGETNFVVNEPALVLDAIKQEYDALKPEKILDLDGVSIYFENFWFNVRGSNTEPLLRVNLEADDKKILEREFAALLKIVKRFMK